ncbi:rab-like protein 2A isoform X2 [Falco peregrinus]|uniref:rab-like protein 2A isoform X2 n=1 Tax=Falco peregrinus TaxID=8954 RepID=UPI00247A8133|nr:rab-like protein 2A isoform X2 [Falco peregrinus]
MPVEHCINLCELVSDSTVLFTVCYRWKFKTSIVLFCGLSSVDTVLHKHLQPGSFPWAAGLQEVLQHGSFSQDFWDTAGQERFQSMHASYYHKAHACIMVFDVQRKVTYKNLNSWYKELREFRPEIPCIVVANKIDADMKVTQKSFNFARKFSLPFYFVSAADGTNVVKLFNDAIKLAVAYKQNSGDFMDEVMQELESFDLQKKSENLSDKEESCPEEKPPSA